MSLMDILSISSQGMTAQRERLEAASANLANASTTRTAEGGAYRRRDVIFQATNIGEQPDSFATVFNNISSSATFQNIVYQPTLALAQTTPTLTGLQGVETKLFIGSAATGNRIYQPNHPDADSQGYVNMPDVDPIEEMTNIVSATRAFEANGTIFNTAKELARATLKLSEV